MIALDTNVLVYAHRANSPFHGPAAACVADLAEGAAAWAIPWPCLHEFLAIVTHPKIYRPPTPPEAARDQVAAWIKSPSLVLLAEPSGYWPALNDVLERSKATAGQVHDARVAALCQVHGVSELWTADRDFSRFASLRCRNPLT